MGGLVCWVRSTSKDGIDPNASCRIPVPVTPILESTQDQVARLKGQIDFLMNRLGELESREGPADPHAYPSWQTSPPPSIYAPPYASSPPYPTHAASYVAYPAHPSFPSFPPYSHPTTTPPASASPLPHFSSPAIDASSALSVEAAILAHIKEGEDMDIRRMALAAYEEVLVVGGSEEGGEGSGGARYSASGEEDC